MALIRGTVLRSDVRPDEPLASAAIVVLCGFACLFVALGFAYLDRRIGRFAVEGTLWTLWVGIGFAGGALGLKGDPKRARNFARTFTVIACVLAMVPGFLMFTLLRWAAFSLLLVTAARAPAMRTRRDFYYALAAIVAVALLVATHGNADWTTWFYLGPAFLCIALALAWDYAAGVQLGRVQRAGMTVGFLAACMALSIAVYAIVPRPNILGFGFLPPGTDTLGRFKVETPSQGTGGKRGDGGPRGSDNGTSGSEQGQQQSVLDEAIGRMREALRDGSLPQAQRYAIGAMLALAETVLPTDLDGRWVTRPMTAQERLEMAQRVAAVMAFLKALLLLLLLAAIALALWLARWRIGVAGALGSARVLERWNPAASMRCSAIAVRWMLRLRGHPMQPGQSVLEHVESAPALPPLPRRWLDAALRLYCAHRFGGALASAQNAVYMRRAIVSSQELLR